MGPTNGTMKAYDFFKPKQLAPDYTQYQHAGETLDAEFGHLKPSETTEEKKMPTTAFKAEESTKQKEPAKTAPEISPYDALMRETDRQIKESYDSARKGYAQNENRARLMNNAQLLGDLAHLGAQTWGASTQGTYKFPKIQQNDKYLQQAEAWKQKLSQSYIDEVTEKNKMQREMMLQKLKDQELRDRYNMMYGWREDYYGNKAGNESTVAQSVADKNRMQGQAAIERANSYSESVSNQNENRDKTTDANIDYKNKTGNAALIRASKTGANTTARAEQKKAEEDQIRRDYAALPDEYKVHKTEDDDYGRRVSVVKDEASLEAKRQKVEDYNHKNGGVASSPASSDGVNPKKKKSVEGIAGASPAEEKTKKKNVPGIATAN